MALPTPSAKFFAVLNKQLTDNNKPTINPAEYSSFAPTPYSGVRSQRNTLLVLDPPLTSTSVGRTTVFYSRIAMAEITGLTVEKGTATSLAELLPALNEALGIALSLSDLEPVASLPASGMMTVTASATNLLYTGTLTFSLMV